MDPDSTSVQTHPPVPVEPTTGLPVIPGYAVIRLLGEGRMGRVYLARQEKSGAEVAIKLMQQWFASSESGTEIFLREIENTKAVLNHANVVRLLDVGWARDALFFAVEYCEGGSVDHLMQARGSPLPPEEALPIILQALDGLEYCHDVVIPFVKLDGGGYAPGRGLVHRDIKPQNLFLAGPPGNRTAKIGDFGLAKAFERAGLSGLTATGQEGGTPAFMPWQQAINYKYAGPEVDVWAMAATLYYLLTNRYPREFPRGVAWSLSLKTAAPVPIRQRNPAIPERLAKVVDEALVERPAIRFKTAAVLKAAIMGAI